MGVFACLQPKLIYKLYKRYNNEKLFSQLMLYKMTEPSVFKVQPKNILGLEHQRFKSGLLALALSKPADYFLLRDKVFNTIVEKAVEDAYNLYWGILTKGLYNDNGSETQIEITGFKFVPNLPESEVNTFALEVAEAVKDIAERAVERVMPMEIKDLAVSRSKQLLPNV